MAKRLFDWLHDIVIGLSERAVDDALGERKEETIDFEILDNPDHPRFHDMQRRYHETQARENRSDLE
jgi:hypothetical protein